MLQYINLLKHSECLSISTYGYRNSMTTLEAR